MSRRALTRRGATLGDLLRQSWRPEPPPLPLPFPPIEEGVPRVLATGCGPLLWRRLRGSPVADEPALRELRAAYRLASLQAAVHEAEIAQVLASISEAGVRCLLIKGWAAARLYPEPGLRPYGDIDLLFHPDDLPRAAALLPLPGSDGPTVEAHAAGMAAYQVLPAAEWTEIEARAVFVPMGGFPVRVPCPEDHLRVLAFHFLIHGGWRPLWLCDIAAALEQPDALVDWDYLLRGGRFQREWIGTTLLLARDLLGADLAFTPPEIREGTYPNWIGEALLVQWGLGTGPSRREALSRAHLRHLGTPVRIWREIRQHWPNRIQACLETGTHPGAPLPGWAQLQAVSARLPRVFRRLGDPQ